MSNLPRPVGERFTIPEVLDRFARYYALPGNGAWGSLHIVLDDGNVDDSHVAFCQNNAHERGDTEGEQLAMILAMMTKSQRSRLGDMAWRRLKELDQ